MTPGSGSPSLHEAMPDIPTELCLVLLTPVQQEASELSSAVSEPSSSWVETLLISLYSCVCFYFCLHCPLLHPCVYLFTCLMGKRGNISSKPLFFTQNKYPVVSHGKRSSFPWAFQPFSVPAQTMLLFCVLVTSLFQMMPFPCTVDEYFPIHASAVWSDTAQAECLQQAVFS